MTIPTYQDLEERFREISPFDLGVVRIVRDESTLLYKVYYSRDVHDVVKGNVPTWFCVRVNHEELLSMPAAKAQEYWDSAEHETGLEAEVFVRGQYAIWEFLEDWMMGFSSTVWQKLLRQIRQELGIPESSGAVMLDPEQVLARNQIARGVIQNHLLYSNVDAP